MLPACPSSEVRRAALPLLGSRVETGGHAVSEAPPGERGTALFCSVGPVAAPKRGRWVMWGFGTHQGLLTLVPGGAAGTRRQQLGGLL